MTENALDSPHRIGVYVFDGAEELDWAGPWEVLASWAQLCPDDGVELFTLAREHVDVRCAKGLQVRADHTWEDAPPIDTLVYPGGPGAAEHLGDEAVRRWLRGLADRHVLVTSVCSGALVLADAGLLDGHPATTHWADIDQLGSLGQDIDVQHQVRFVDAGPVVTAAGVSAGIDMSLHLVARLHSVERARQVRRYIQYARLRPCEGPGAAVSLGERLADTATWPGPTYPVYIMGLIGDLSKRPSRRNNPLDRSGPLPDTG